MYTVITYGELEEETYYREKEIIERQMEKLSDVWKVCENELEAYVFKNGKGLFALIDGRMEENINEVEDFI